MIGAVICGGQSTRMGVDKATLLVEGQMMTTWVAQALSRAGLDPVVALGGSEEVGLARIPDAEGVVGPMAALIAGLRAHDQLFVCPCDVPALSTDLVRRVLAAAETSERPAVLAHSGQLEPLIGVYRGAALRILERGWSAGARGPKMALVDGDVTTVSVAADEVINVNTPGDIERIRERLADSR